MKASYVRVSTLEQNTARQLDGKQGKIFWDKCSGTIAFEDRDAGSKLIQSVKDEVVDEVRVHSIDRLGRNAINVLETIKFFTEQGVNVVSEKEGLHTLLKDGKPNPVAKLLASILSTLAEIDYNNRREAQAEGIALAKAKGKYKGRQKGTALSDAEYLQKHDDIVKELASGETIRRTVSLTSKSKSTVQRVKKAMSKNR